jgi:hypothetical protein
MRRPDMILTHHGRPVMVVEVKGRRITDEFRRPVETQVLDFARDAGAAWALLVDPDSVDAFRVTPDGLERLGSIPTGHVLARVGLQEIQSPGEFVLLNAVQRWFRSLAAGDGQDAVEPGLAEFFTVSAQVDDPSLEASVA